MARTPKTQPSLEAAAPARRGRTKTAAALPELPLAASAGEPATNASGADAPEAAPSKAPGRWGPGRKPKRAVGAEVAPSTQDDVAGRQGQAPGQPGAEASPGLTGDAALAAAAVPQAEAAADSDPVQPDRDPVSSAGEAAQSVPEADTSVPPRPAAHWDQAADRVRFDWPAIEQTAAQDGPNQAMAKLLLAARAEGASSRWPF